MIETAVSESLRSAPSHERGRLTRLLLLEAIACIAASMMMAGIFFYTQKKFGWGAKKNLLLCATQGAVYVLGAMASHPISQRVGKRGLLRILHAGMAAITLPAIFWLSATMVAAVVIGYVMLAAAQWPMLESLVSSGAGSAQLSRRISIYNLIWSGTGAIAVAGCGPIIAHFPGGIFVLALMLHLTASAMLLRREQDPDASLPEHVRPEPELVPLRTLAMRLSRVVLPATYAVSYALTALMPTLPAVLRLGEAMRTVVGSVWLMGRWFSFLLLGMNGWWHTRPRALLAAAVVLLASFLGCTLIDKLIPMMGCQFALGLAVGIIYSGSLYFGMVLSSGSSEQSGYHEALIGLGSTIGPGAGALMQTFLPASQNASVYAVSGVLLISIMGAAWVSLMARRRKERLGVLCQAG